MLDLNLLVGHRCMNEPGKDKLKNHSTKFAEIANLQSCVLNKYLFQVAKFFGSFYATMGH